MVLLPDGTVRLPDGSVKLPDGRLRRPNGSFAAAAADGSFPPGPLGHDPPPASLPGVTEPIWFMCDGSGMRYTLISAMRLRAIVGDAYFPEAFVSPRQGIGVILPAYWLLTT